MSSADVDFLLLEFGASIEVDDNDQYFLKIRFFPTELFSTGITAQVVVGSYCDTFYHSIDKTLRCGDTYFRSRQDLDHPVQQHRIVRQYCKNLTSCSHCYREEKLESLPADMVAMIKYQFRRQALTVTGLPEGSEVYADTIFQPVDYSIVTLRVKLKFDPTQSACLELLKEKLTELRVYSSFPVFTKFMLVLQCSTSFILYETLYVQSDPARDSVSSTMVKVFSDKPALLKNRDYIWFVSNQIEHAQQMHDTGYDEADCYSRLRTLRPVGKEIIDSWDDDYF